MCKISFNRFRKDLPEWTDDHLAALARNDILDCHRSFAQYRETPLVPLPALADALGLGSILVKDEAHRFGLKAFKVLGASYAIRRLLKQRPETKFTFCTATDGNHGRAVAWTARQSGHKAVIFMPADTASARIKAIRAEKAEVRVVNGTYDEAVRLAAEEADRHGWQVIADTAYGDYRAIPADIMAGYMTLFVEIEKQINSVDDPAFDFVFLPAGVGSLAASAIWYYVNRYGKNRPCLVIVEPIEAACMMASLENPSGDLTEATGNFRTIMAGLNCGTPSLLAWPIIKTGADLGMAVSDKWAEQAMKTFYFPRGHDQRIISGESGAAGLAALLALSKSEMLAKTRAKLGWPKKNRVLLINTEGATDPENFAKIIAGQRQIEK